MNHFTFVCWVTWPLNGSEAIGDLVLIQTLLFLLCKSSCSYANYLAFKWEKQRGLFQSKVTSNLACIIIITKYIRIIKTITAYKSNHFLVSSIELCCDVWFRFVLQPFVIGWTVLASPHMSTIFTPIFAME